MQYARPSTQLDRIPYRMTSSMPFLHFLLSPDQLTPFLPKYVHDAFDFLALLYMSVTYSSDLSALLKHVLRARIAAAPNVSIRWDGLLSPNNHLSSHRQPSDPHCLRILADYILEVVELFLRHHFRQVICKHLAAICPVTAVWAHFATHQHACTDSAST